MFDRAVNPFTWYASDFDDHVRKYVRHVRRSLHGVSQSSGNSDDMFVHYILTNVFIYFSVVNEDDKVIVIYNRIPKTGSTSFMHLPYELCDENKFNVLLLNISNPHSMTFSDRIFFANNVSHWYEKMPALYHGHFAYFDVQNMGVQTGNVKFININIVRQPLER